MYVFPYLVIYYYVNLQRKFNRASISTHQGVPDNETIQLSITNNNNEVMKKIKRIYESPRMRDIKLESSLSLLAGSQLENYKNGGDIWKDDNYDN